MTLRTLSTAILRGSLRHALPASQEWGQAMLRELDFVEGDAAALWWALGSAISLLKPRLLPRPPRYARITNLAEISFRTQILMESARRITFGGVIGSIWMTVVFTHRMLSAPHLLQRIANGMFGFAALCNLLYFLHLWFAGRRNNLLSGTDTTACDAFYRAELIRRRSMHSGPVYRTRLIATALLGIFYCFASVMDDPRAALQFWSIGATVLMALIPLGIWMNNQQAREYQRQIDEFDAVRQIASIKAEL